MRMRTAGLPVQKSKIEKVTFVANCVRDLYAKNERHISKTVGGVAF
jgi:hypothetical protein